MGRPKGQEGSALGLGAGELIRSRDPRWSPLPRELGAPRRPGLRWRNRCLGVSPGLNDSELRPTGNRELSFLRCPPARVSSRRQRELWALRMGAGERDPARGTGRVSSQAGRGWAEHRGWRGETAQEEEETAEAAGAVGGARSG